MELTIHLSSVPLCLAVIVFVITLIVILWFIIKFLQIIWIFCLSYYCRSGAKWCGGPNTWAVITGATDGIGLEYAEAMAEKGYNLMLMSRNASRLNDIKKKIELSYRNCTEVKTLAVDFSKTGIYGYIEEELKKLGEIHVLINNVGISYTYPEFLTELENSAQFLSDMINVNVLAMTRLIDLVLPRMVSKERGIIINVSSFSALFPTPLLSVYSATKIYADYLSRALSVEYAPKGIIIQSVLPYYVSTNMIKNPKLSFMIPSPEKFVKSALKTVGLESRTYGVFQHTIFAFLQNFLIKFLIGEDFNIKLAFWRMKRMRDNYCNKRKIFRKLIDNAV